jgi:integrase/recombinase XerC
MSRAEIIRIDAPVLPTAHAAPGTLAAATIDLMDAIWADVAERTALAYAKDYRDFAAFLGTSDGPTALAELLRLSSGDANATALAYRAHMQRRGLKPATIARRLGALKTAVRCARTIGRVAWTLDVPMPTVERYRDVRGPGLAGFLKMMAAAETRIDAKGVRDRAMMRLFWGLALRRGELVALDLADVDLDGDRIAVKAKGRTASEWLTLPLGAKAALEEWIRVRGPWPGPLFVNLHLRRPGGRLTGLGAWKIVRALGAKAGLSRPTRPHGLRHAAISECSRLTNGNAHATQRFARHKSPVTTAHYIDEFEDRFGQLARLVDGASDS